MSTHSEHYNQSIASSENLSIFDGSENARRSSRTSEMDQLSDKKDLKISIVNDDDIQRIRSNDYSKSDGTIGAGIDDISNMSA